MMKKILFSVMVLACSFLLMPVVNAKSAPVMEGNYFFANGTPVTINAREDGEAGATITWDGGKQDVTTAVTVFGGSHESDERLETTSVTMNGGEVHGIFGGGLHKSNVGTAKVVVNAGKLNFVQGGGASSLSGSTCHKPWYAGDPKNSPNRVDSAEVLVVNGTGVGSYPLIYGGGEGISYVGKTDVTVKGGNWDYVIAGGSNGYTGDANLTIKGGKIGVVQSVNRGSMDSAYITIEGGEITTAYVGGDASDKNVTGTIADAAMEITGGKVTTVAVGTNGGQNKPAKDVATLIYDEDVVENIDESTFAEDAVATTFDFTVSIDGVTETVKLPKGLAFTKADVDSLIEKINAQLKEKGFKFGGFYTSKDFDEEFDMTKEMNEDVTVYVKLVQFREDEDKEGVTNPDTSDIGLVGVIVTILVAGAGLGYTIKKRKFN